MSETNDTKKLGVDERTVESLIKIGFLKSAFERNVRIYRYFLDRLDEGANKTEAAARTGAEFKISARHVFRIISKFSEIIEL